MSNIPRTRDILRTLHFKLHNIMGELADVQKALDEAEALTHRRKPVRAVTRVKSTRMTAEVAAEIRHHAARCPDESHQQIANAFGVNTGRVSEALQGDR